MKRKLFSVLLSAFALLLLMGAGPAPEQETPMLAEEESATLHNVALETETQSLIKAGEAENSAAAELAKPADEQTLTLKEDVDDKLLFDGVKAPKTLGKVQRNGVTYVDLGPTAKLLDPKAQLTWDKKSGSSVVTTDKLRLTVRVGDYYVEANGRYLYLGEPVQAVNGHVVLPLNIIAKCFDAKVTWDNTAKAVRVTRGSGAIKPGSAFYNQDDLFWLSRVITAESGNQPLKGKMAVGNVVMNRVASPIYPNTVQGVLAQKNQFSTYKGGRLAKRTPNASSVIAAKLVLDGGVVEETKGALYFDSSRSSWASRNKTCIATIGGHKFYR